jgi:hypothetical protein
MPCRQLEDHEIKIDHRRPPSMSDANKLSLHDERASKVDVEM